MKKNKKNLERKNQLEIVEKLIITLTILFSILIVAGIVVSIKNKNVAFWITSISSGCLFFSIFALIIVIFLKEIKNKQIK